MYNRKLTVVVFGAAHMGNNPGFAEVAYELGREIAKAGFILVNGAGPGLMSEVSRGAKEHGGYVIGVGLKGKEANPYVDEYSERTGIHARQAFLFALGDAFVGLPGGMGTLYELSEISELKKLNEEEPEPVIMLNHEGFYDNYKGQLDLMRESGFVPEPISQYIDITSSVSEILGKITSFYENGVDEIKDHTDLSQVG